MSGISSIVALQARRRLVKRVKLRFFFFFFFDARFLDVSTLASLGSQWQTRLIGEAGDKQRRGRQDRRV